MPIIFARSMLMISSGGRFDTHMKHYKPFRRSTRSFVAAAMAVVAEIPGGKRFSEV